MIFHHCGIVGLGLLGGSLALDLRKQFPGMRITGIARRDTALAEAAAMRCEGVRVFSSVSRDLDAVRTADLVVLCTPIKSIIDQLAQLSPIFAAGTLVTDVGSSKRAIMNAAATVMPPAVHFIGGHPMAGSDRAGLSHARAGLYRGATWAICIPPGEDEAAERLIALVEALGAHPLTIDAELHDDLVAQTSHLPHVIAGALTNLVLGGARFDLLEPFLAGGFRDCTRIAAASPAMWRDILLTNRDRVLLALEAMRAEIDNWQQAIQAGDAPHLEALLTTAHQRRERLNQKRLLNADGSKGLGQK